MCDLHYNIYTLFGLITELSWVSLCNISFKRISLSPIVPGSGSNLLPVEEGAGGGLSEGCRGVQRCPSTVSYKAQSVGTYTPLVLCGLCLFILNLLAPLVYSYLSYCEYDSPLDSRTPWVFLYCYTIWHKLISCACVSVADTAIEGVSNPSSSKDTGPASPMVDRKKHRKKKSMNLKGDTAIGQADGKLPTVVYSGFSEVKHSEHCR